MLDEQVIPIVADVSIRASLRRAKRCARRVAARRPLQVSIRASLRRAKRSAVAARYLLAKIVSIRASLRRAKRFDLLIGDRSYYKFQSALRSEERSDLAYRDGFRGLHPFQSALRSEERSDLLSFASRSVSARFNPRFAPKSEAINGRKAEGTASNGFNPRFAPKSEAMCGSRSIPLPEDVSIRASLRRAKRCAGRRRGFFAHDLFQSALRSEERSDAAGATAAAAS